MKAKEHFSRCIDVDFKMVHAYISLAYIYNVHGLNGEAIKICKLCKENNKESYLCYRMWAFASFKKGDIPTAIKKIKKAVVHFPKDSQNWMVWGLIMRTVGNYASAQKKFEKAILLDADNSTAKGELEIVKRIISLDRIIPLEVVPSVDEQ
jgi:Tfp pilus assembly protein PilF